MDGQNDSAKPQNRRYPPHVLKVEETEFTALFVDTDGTVYRKYYDPEYGGGVGRRRIRLGAPLILLRPSVRHAIAEAWAAQDQAHERIEQRRELARASATEIVHRAQLDMTADELCAQAGQIAGYELPDGSRLLLRTSPHDSVTPQWRLSDGSTDPVDLTVEQATEVLTRTQTSSTPVKAPVRANVPVQRIKQGREAPGVQR